MTLIDTHEHGDHTGGNSVWADTTIVAHELLRRRDAADRRTRTHPRLAGAAPRRNLEKEVAKHPAGSVEARRAAEQLAFALLNHEVFRANAEPVLPTKTFSDRLTLDMGDTTFEPLVHRRDALGERHRRLRPERGS